MVGRGNITCEVVGDSAEITDLSFNYPLRLMKPKTHVENHQAVYLLSYGGGLLQNDCIHLTIQVNDNARLSVLSQASTKVYKRTDIASCATQTIVAHVAQNSFLAILPEPVTCFAQSAYQQSQEFRIHASSSLLLLDWMTSGRGSRGESWKFDSYLSKNIIYIDDILVLRDAWQLQSQIEGEIYKRMMPYQCVANIVMIGNALESSIADAMKSNNEVVIYKNGVHQTQQFIWSTSPLFLRQKNVGIIIRAAAIDTATMRAFIVQRFARIDGESFSLFSRI